MVFVLVLLIKLFFKPLLNSQIKTKIQVCQKQHSHDNYRTWFTYPIIYVIDLVSWYITVQATGIGTKLS